MISIEKKVLYILAKITFSLSYKLTPTNYLVYGKVSVVCGWRDCVSSPGHFPSELIPGFEIQAFETINCDVTQTKWIRTINLQD
jgi:hypothetical protein